MNASTVLYVYFISDPDEIYIATYDGIEPDAAIVAHDYIAHNCGIGSNEAICSELGIPIFNRKYNRHTENVSTNIRKQPQLQISCVICLSVKQKRYLGKNAL